MTYLYKENKLKALTILLLVIGCLWQNLAEAAPTGVSVAPEPSWIKKLPLRTSTNINPDDVNGGFHYLLMNRQREVAREESYNHFTYMLLTEEGVQNSSEIRLSFDPNFEQLRLHKVQVWRNGKLLDKLDLSKVKVIQREEGMDAGIYDETLTAVLVLDDIRVGDVVDYSFTTKGFNPVFGGKFFTSFNLQEYDPVDELYIGIVAPAERKFQFKYHLDARKPKVQRSNGATSYTWHLKDLPATKIDNNIPAWFDPYPGVYVSEFKDWKEVVQWALPLFEVREKPSVALQDKINSIKAQAGSDEERIQAALRFVQDEVRYLGFEAGIGGYKPHPPSQVFANRFGDCKDKALLLAYMLRQMNIKASPALVNSSLTGHVQDLLPSPYAFNHCIVRVELLGGKVFWYDATISKQRGNYDNTYVPAYGQALVLAPNSASLSPVVGPLDEEPTVRVREIYHIDEVGDEVVLEVRTEYTGAQADYQRSSFATTSMQDIRKNYLNFYANAYPEIELAEDPHFEDSEWMNLVVVTEKYRIPNFWQPQHENEGVLEAWFSPLVISSYISQLQTSKRTMPMALNHPVHVAQSIKVLLPQSWPVDNTSQEIDDDAFLYTRKVTYSPNGTELNIDLTYKSKQDHVAAGATSAYLRNQKAMLDNITYGLTFNKAFVNSVSEFKFSWGLFLFGVLLAAGFGFGAYKLYFWDPAQQAGEWGDGGESLGGWLILPLIGLLFTPISIISFFTSNGYFNSNLWQGLMDTGSGAYSPATVLLLALELIFNTALLVFSVLLITLYLKRRASVPRLMVIFYGGRLAFFLFELLIGVVFSLKLYDGDSGMELFRTVIACGIWIPYFLRSSRVKATFVERLRPQVMDPQVMEEDPREPEAEEQVVY